MHFSPRIQTLSSAEAVSGRDRVRDVDVLRGFALLGILLVNIQSMAGPHVGPGGGTVVSWADEVAGWLVTALVSAKFWRSGSSPESRRYC
ncbi:hypothetical protein [Streptomyces sp. Inha503]|uniref:hypothetical protein n=1 Tax=Streptomyces sp. Inha503 TaxID=3383314 RepID=UPI0039A0A8FB